MNVSQMPVLTPTACTAYSRYILDIGQSEDWLALQISMLPCLLGYAMIAQRLHQEQLSRPTIKANPYLTWINNYVAEDYTAAVVVGRGRCMVRLLVATEIELMSFRSHRKARSQAIAAQNRRARQDLCTCDQGTTTSNLAVQRVRADAYADGDWVLGHGFCGLRGDLRAGRDRVWQRARKAAWATTPTLQSR